MFITFDQLPEDARIWIYQMDKAISPDEEQIIQAKMTSFCEQWVAHENPLQTSFRIFYNRFLVIAVNEAFNSIGGCSIDGSIRVLRELQQELGIDFLNRHQVACWIQGQVVAYPIAELKKQIASRSLDSSVLMFDNLVSTKQELENSWKIPIQSSWVGQMIPSYSDQV